MSSVIPTSQYEIPTRCARTAERRPTQGRQPMIGTREEWMQARRELLEDEKELTRRSDALAAKRRELPWVAVEQDYVFDTVDGPRPLAELFDGRTQLVVYHFMHGPLTPE